MQFAGASSGDGARRTGAFLMAERTTAWAECALALTVCVSHDKSPGTTCIDDGQSYNPRLVAVTILAAGLLEKIEVPVAAGLDGDSPERAANQSRDRKGAIRFLTGAGSVSLDAVSTSAPMDQSAPTTRRCRRPCS